MNSDRIQARVHQYDFGCNLVFRETELLFSFCGLLYLKKTGQLDAKTANAWQYNKCNVKGRVLDTLSRHAPAFLEILLPHFSPSPTNGETQEVWHVALDLFSVLEKDGSLQNNEDIVFSFQALLYRLAENSNQLGEYTVPEEITTLVTWLIEHEISEKKEPLAIYDPACGSGALLLHALQFVGNRETTVTGYANNRIIADICTAQFFLSSTEINWRVLCERPEPMENQFDLVVSRIPFGQRQERHHLNNMLKSAGPSGTVIAIIPNGILFRMDGDAELRRTWIRKNQLDALIYLPENLLYTTRIPVTIVVLKRQRSDNSAVRLIDLSHGEVIGRRQSRLGDTLLHTALQSVFSIETIPERCRFISHDEFLANDCLLNRGRYFPKEDAENLGDASAASLEEIHNLQLRLQQTQRQLEEYYPRSNH